MTRPSTRLVAPCYVAAALVLASAAPDVSAKPPKPSGYEPTAPAAAIPPHVADGSIFNASGYASLYQGNRARAVGDPLTIVLVESTSTSKSAGSKTQRSGSFGITPPTSGLLSFLNPNALKASGQGSFNGSGNAIQTSAIDATVAVTIAEVRANGTALVRGEKRMMLSQGQEWIQFAGIVRLSDISADNQIASTRVADAKIEYAGKGAVQRASREGWLSRFFNLVTPF